ncbi:hypothetical protein [Streptomyces sp. NBC_00829]|uniref:hypothetical protein n=1 Tax=Streptomyces sp. NBC_00829 TaxID=2903679 RepID=UPI00386DD6E9|nr:hypothetical protein OG293_20355 [Streptomyces sp. NBC_00829]
MAGTESEPKFDHVVSVMFENRTFDKDGFPVRPGRDHIPGLDPKTATGRQANDYMNGRTARIYPGLVTAPS